MRDFETSVPGRKKKGRTKAGPMVLMEAAPWIPVVAAPNPIQDLPCLPQGMGMPFQLTKVRGE